MKHVRGQHSEQWQDQSAPAAAYLLQELWDSAAFPTSGLPDNQGDSVVEHAVTDALCKPVHWQRAFVRHSTPLLLQSLLGLPVELVVLPTTYYHAYHAVNWVENFPIGLKPAGDNF